VNLCFFFILFKKISHINLMSYHVTMIVWCDSGSVTLSCQMSSR